MQIGTAEAPGGRLQGRVALVTGASRGLGRAVALRYAREGADLVLLARSPERLAAVEAEGRAAGRDVLALCGDLTGHTLFGRVANAIGQRWGRLDVLVGNAAELGEMRCVPEIEDAEWERLLAVNLTANWRLLKALHPLLAAAPAARAIFATSTAAQGKPQHGAYAVSKAALEALVRLYAAEVTDTNIRVNLINPGPARTQMRAKALPHEDPMTVKAPEEKTDAFVALAEASCTESGAIVMG